MRKFLRLEFSRQLQDWYLAMVVNRELWEILLKNCLEFDLKEEDGQRISNMIAKILLASFTRRVKTQELLPTPQD